MTSIGVPKCNKPKLDHTRSKLTNPTPTQDKLNPLKFLQVT